MGCERPIRRAVRKAIVPNVPIVPTATPAFLEDYNEEGSEWGWSGWDGVDWNELRGEICFRQQHSVSRARSYRVSD